MTARLVKLGPKANKPLCDDLTIFRIRLARENEKALYYKNSSSL